MAEPRTVSTSKPDETLERLKKKLEEHYALYDKKDLNAEKADYADMMNFMKGYDLGADGKTGFFVSKSGHNFEISNGTVKGPEFGGPFDGNPAHIENVIELMVVAKGAFEQDKGYFNTPYKEELPIAGYIAKRLGFKLENAPDVPLDPAVKKRIDDALDKMVKDKVVTLAPVAAAPPAPVPAFDGTKLSGLTTLIGGQIDTIETLFKADKPPIPAQSTALIAIRQQLTEIGKNPNDPQALAKLEVALKTFEKDFGATVPADKKITLTADIKNAPAGANGSQVTFGDFIKNIHAHKDGYTAANNGLKPVVPAPAPLKTAPDIAETIHKKLQTLNDTYAQDDYCEGTPGQQAALATLNEKLDGIQNGTGTAVGLTKSIDEFTEKYGKEIPEGENRKAFIDEMDKFKKEILETAAKNKIALEPVKPETPAAPVPPANPPAPPPETPKAPGT